MKPNHAEICWADNLEPDFQQVPLVQFFLKFSQYCCETAIIQIHQKKKKKKKKKNKKNKKNIFLDKD